MPPTFSIVESSMIGDKKSQKKYDDRRNYYDFGRNEEPRRRISAKISANFVPLDILLEPHLGF